MNATRTAGLVAGAVVALVAFAASYTHMRQLAAEHGQGWLSWLIPLSVDGLLMVASLVIVTARRDRAGEPWLAWLALAVGVVASLAANVAAAGLELVSGMGSECAPVGFAVTFELVLRLVRAHDADEKVQVEAPHTGVGLPELATRGGASPTLPDQDVRAEPDRSVPPVDRYDEAPTGEPIEAGERSDDELMIELRTLAEQLGGTPSIGAVRTGLRVGTSRAYGLLDRYAAEQKPALRAIGSEPR